MDRIGFACLFYALMGGVGLLLMVWRIGGDATLEATLRWPTPWGGPFLIVLLGIVVTHGLSRWLSEKIAMVRRSAWEIRRYLGELNPKQILWLALFSGFGEELFFRGWLLPETGLFFSSLIFGLIHVPLNRDWMLWPVFAFLMGLLLGWLTLWSGHLLWPILLHAGINYWNLRYFLRPIPTV